MSRKRKRWTTEEKLQILRDGAHFGMSEASRMHGVSTSMLYKWKSQYEEHGESGLSRKGSESGDQEKRELEREIERLRQVVADQALTIRIKDELLKKTRYR